MEAIISGQCHCGCGEVTTVYRGQPRKFLPGHQARGSNNSRFGTTMSDGSKLKISKANTGRLSGDKNPFYGRTHTDETKKIISDKNKALVHVKRCNLSTCTVCEKTYYHRNRIKSAYCSKECQSVDYVYRFSGDKNPFYGKTHTDETKEFIRQNTLRQRANQVFRPTKPELAVQSKLTENNILFISEHLINNKFCVDIFIPEFNLIIFIDGCYWHACPTHCPTAKKPKTDNARKPYLTKCGYNVEIIWEHDIKTKLDKIIKALIRKYDI